MPSPNTTTGNNILTAVSCATTSNCFAVGGVNSAPLKETALGEYWNGTNWTIVPTENGSGGYSVLNAVSCIRQTTVCTAVGESFNGSDFQTLIETWNGSGWSIVPSPEEGSGTSQLTGISCASSTTCVAVGFYTKSNLDQTLAEQWQGTTWSALSSPDPSTNDTLNSVSCAKANRCVAVGYYQNATPQLQTLVETWSGSGWMTTPSPNEGSSENVLNGVSCAGATDCVAVGRYNVPHFQTLVEVWTGDTWTISPSAQPGETQILQAVSCKRYPNCVAVGYTTSTSSTIGETLIEGWSGTSWSTTPSPNEGSSDILNGVSCPHVRQCVAVGDYSGASALQTLTLMR